MYQYVQANAAPARNIDGVMVKPPAHLSAQFLMQNRLPLYVITAIPPQSNYTITIKQGGGLPGAPLRIERSKLPQLIEHSHDALAKGGRDVWNAVDKGMLVLVWPSDAQKLLVGKKAEAERAQLSKWSALNTEKSDVLKEHEKILKAAKDANDNAEIEASEAEEAHDPINARVMDIVARTKAGEVKLDKAVAEFENMSEVMTERDYQYAITNVKGGKLREWLQAQLASGVAAPAVKKAKKSKKADTGSVLDDAEPEMTDEEREAEALAEAEARGRQRIGG